MALDPALEVLNLKVTARLLHTVQRNFRSTSMESIKHSLKLVLEVSGTKFTAPIKVHFLEWMLLLYNCNILYIISVKSIIHEIYSFEGNQGFLSMLKQRFSRSSNWPTSDESSSLPRPGKSNKRNARFYDDDNKNGADRLAPTTSGNLNATNATNSANVTPEMMRRSYAPEMRNEATVRY